MEHFIHLQETKNIHFWNEPVKGFFGVPYNEFNIEESRGSLILYYFSQYTTFTNVENNEYSKTMDEDIRYLDKRLINFIVNNSHFIGDVLMDYKKEIKPEFGKYSFKNFENKIEKYMKKYKKQDNMTIEEILMKKENKTEKMRKENKELKNKIIEYENVLELFKEKSIELNIRENMVNELKKENSDLKDKIVKYEKIKELFKEKSIELNRCENMVNELKKENSDLKDKIVKYENIEELFKEKINKLNRFENVINELKKEKYEKDEKIEKYEKTINELKKEKYEKDEKIEKYEKTINEKDEKIKILEISNEHLIEENNIKQQMKGGDDNDSVITKCSRKWTTTKNTPKEDDIVKYKNNDYIVRYLITDKNKFNLEELKYCLNYYKQLGFIKDYEETATKTCLKQLIGKIRNSCEFIQLIDSFLNRTIDYEIIKNGGKKVIEKLVSKV